MPSIAGVLVTATQADFVTSITFVDGKGDIHTVDRDCFEGRGLLGGLGMLGVITEVTLKLQVKHKGSKNPTEVAAGHVCCCCH
jgi:FAD/FMN-containing dehydrogenase